MAITKSKDEFVASCTECGVEHYGGTIDDFRAFVQDLKDEGWKIKNVDGEFQHICPECQE